MHTGLHADGVADVALQHLVQTHQKVDGALFGQVDFLQVSGHQRCDRLQCQVRRQFGGGFGFVLEGEVFSFGFQKEVERVVNRHFDNQIDRHLEFPNLLGEHQTRLVIGKGVLLPVHKMLGRFDFKRVGNDVAAAMRCGAQSNNLWSQLDQAVVGVVGDVAQCGVNRHGDSAIVRATATKKSEQA